jgi:hypothetical protein
MSHNSDHTAQALSAGSPSEASVLAGISRSPTRDDSGSPALRATRAGWFALGALGAGLIGSLLPSASAWQGTGTNPPQTQAQPILSSGGATSDSNNRMIAVTGLDLTGQSVLYLVDTQEMQLACYQATGGAGGTQGVRLVGARRIELDLMLDGFNDKTEDQKGNLLPFKALLKQFQASGLVDPNR